MSKLKTMEEIQKDKCQHSDNCKCEDWFQRHRLLTFGIFLLIIWGSLLIFWWLKADAISKDPCTICAERYDETVICTLDTGFIPLRRAFYPNGTIYDELPAIVSPDTPNSLSSDRINSLNFSLSN